MLVLLVEDDLVLSSVLSEVLREDGCDVVEAVDGEAGLACFGHEPDRFNILITNVQLPGALQGGDVAARVRSRRPDIPVVIASGAPEALQERWSIQDGYIVLSKPYRFRQLKELVHSLNKQSTLKLR